MTLTIELPPETEQRLREAAQLRGITAEEHVLQMIHQNLPAAASERAEKFRAWLEQVHEQGDDEGDCSWDEILRRMDESRPEGRKLFPPELKGITW
jgi:hypothetical protein